MRKRDRDRLAVKLEKLSEQLGQNGVGQLWGAAWYFTNGAEGKGVSGALAALSWFERGTRDLKEILKKLGY